MPNGIRLNSENPWIHFSEKLINSIKTSLSSQHLKDEPRVVRELVHSITTD